MTIGIIEDDSLLNQALEIALQNAGYYTISAHTRKEALDLLREKVDVFLIDIGLPDGNGIELYQELQMEKRIPAIFLTARDEEKEMLLAFDAGAQGLRGEAIFHEGIDEAAGSGIKEKS